MGIAIFTLMVTTYWLTVTLSGCLHCTDSTLIFLLIHSIVMLRLSLIFQEFSLNIKFLEYLHFTNLVVSIVNMWTQVFRLCLQKPRISYQYVFSHIPQSQLHKMVNHSQTSIIYTNCLLAVTISKSKKNIRCVRYRD